ncbi:UPF0728 protein C10orf53 homolog [Polyodon spathula]|uniref:UPF0728 protein C10orf53 homolog n=1 Tax=Polyodon spathula TaxID=7913 RepID=UPI001B7EA316|nr:UPF0728 protein C10orf53 homolog [Polyodon spathula]
MPGNALVIVKFGPYESCGTVEHRTFRLQGLQATLIEDGHRCVLEKIPEWNTVELLVNGDKVFHCNIKDLDFGGDGKLDPLCQEARTAVLNAY